MRLLRLIIWWKVNTGSFQICRRVIASEEGKEACCVQFRKAAAYLFHLGIEYKIGITQAEKRLGILMGMWLVVLQGIVIWKRMNISACQWGRKNR